MPKAGVRSFVVDGPDQLPHGQELPFREPAARDVVVRVRYCLLGSWDRPRPAATPGAAFPRVPGRYILGTVESCGTDGEHLRDATVIVPAVLPCGECDACSRARATLCRDRLLLGQSILGGLTSTLTVPGRYLLPLAGDLQVSEDGFPEMSAVGLIADLYQGVCEAGVGAGSVALILGSGFRADLLRQLLLARGAHLLKAGDRATVLAQAQARDLPLIGWKVFVLDSEELARAHNLLTPAATWVILDDVRGTLEVSHLLHEEATVRTSRAAHPDLYPEATALLLRKEIRVSLPDPANYESLPEAWTGLADPAQVILVRVAQ